jgi:hypothetical protein
VSTSQRPRARPSRGGPRRGRIRLRLQWIGDLLYGPLVQAVQSRRTYKGHRGGKEKKAWHRSRPLVRLIRAAIYIGATILVLLVIMASTVVITSNTAVFLVNIDEVCEDTSFSCDTLAGILFPLFSLALASAVFLLHRYSRVKRPVVRAARENPHEIVQTAGSIIGEVVGRDQLCRVIVDDLHDRNSRLPNVVIGGVGTGKTALLVRLTQMLAERGAVPVPVRLRDAQDRLDFRDLARERFLAEVAASVLSDAEGEKVWRQLCKDDRIVVLADGLEEALIEGELARERDTLVRLAIRRANDNRLPLISASRPHDPLRLMDATIVELEPLSEEAALQYIQRKGSNEYEHRLTWVVETADLAETPLYLQITRQLHQLDLLANVSPRRDDKRLDTRSVDRAELRWRLLQTWMEALIKGYFPSGLALSPDERRATVDQLSALACIGLRQDSLYVKFDDLKGLVSRAQQKEKAARSITQNRPADSAGEDIEEPEHPEMIRELRHRLGEHGRRADIRLAASQGVQLGLVEVRGDGVRFPHSIMQAYLGSRLIHHAMADSAYRDSALGSAGREFLLALVMLSRAKAQAVDPQRTSRVLINARTDAQPLRDLLSEAANHHEDVKALDIYAAALEIDSIDHVPKHYDIAAKLRAKWQQVWAPDQRTLEESKLNVVRRFGEAARTIAERRVSEPNVASDAASRGESGYLCLYGISQLERSYPVRLAIAQEIGSGGDDAFYALKGMLGTDITADRLDPHDAEGCGEGGAGIGPEPDDAERLERWWRGSVTRAWLAPLLVGSVTASRRDARNNLQQWLRFVRSQARDDAEHHLPLSLEVALAQGLKHAANRRRRHPHTHAEARAYLAEQAREMLRGAKHWFSRLTLLHALCLWSLPDEPSDQQSNPGRDVDYRALVENWLTLPEGRIEHPFVVEGRRLAIWALHTKQPERFIWIDESGIVARVGSQAVTPGLRRTHNLWIPPSTGWTALHPRAQQLVADVLLLLNLAERGDPSDRERRLQRTNRDDLPPCLTGDRTPLDASRTIGIAETLEPGSNCTNGCPFELCPYPPKGEQGYRAELSEAFCRKQQALLSGRGIRRRVASWQEALPKDLKRFWMQMARRMHPVNESDRNADRTHRRARQTRSESEPTRRWTRR